MDLIANKKDASLSMFAMDIHKILIAEGINKLSGVLNIVTYWFRVTLHYMNLKSKFHHVPIKVANPANH
jgi:hypothetical protein